MTSTKGTFSVPENIRKLKPKGTMVKKIHNKYYVYNFKNEKINGKWKTKMGNLIGTITLADGFIPKEKFIISDEPTVLEFGQYLFAYELGINVLEKLKIFFNVQDANKIYLMSIIHFVNKFTHLKDISTYFEQSYLYLKYPNVKMGYTSLSNLLDSLGRRQTKVLEFQQHLINESSKEIAIDGHVISNSSHENDLAEYGNKFSTLKEMQINVLMAYDVNNLKPLFSKVYEGGMLDKTSVKDLLNIQEFKDTLFIIDKGFYSSENIVLFSQNGNEYIIPLAQNLKDYKEVTKEMNLDKRFVYERNKKVSTIEYKELKKEDKTIYVYRDLNQNAIDQANYLKNMSNNPEKYTEENFNKVKDFFGVIVLQTNSNKKAEEIFKLYKKRWKIETYYDYFKNNLDCNALCLSDYYMTQGLSFVMLVVGLIHKEVKDKLFQSDIKMSIDDCLLQTRFLKIHKHGYNWETSNIKKGLAEIIKKMEISIKI